MEKTDPVCGMSVDESTQFKSLYKSKIYYFCSAKCRVEFEKDPEGYLKSGPRAMPD
ncbi:MAG: YHS domain-containing protein [Nitrososphaeria archaeon]